MVEFIKRNLSMVHVVYTMPAISLLPYPSWNILIINGSLWWRDNSKLFTAIRYRKVHGLWTNYREVFIFPGMPFCRHKFSMHAFVREVQTELIIFYTIQPTNCPAR